MREILRLYGLPIGAGFLVFILLNALTGNWFLIFQVGIAIGVGVFVWRLVRSDL
jgi:Flp pilus assembly protein TadB